MPGAEENSDIHLMKIPSPPHRDRSIKRMLMISKHSKETEVSIIWKKAAKGMANRWQLRVYR